MSENEYLENEEVVTDDQSQDEYQEYDSTLENQEETEDYESEEPQHESFIKKLRRENRELKRQLKKSWKESKPADPDIAKRVRRLELKDTIPEADMDWTFAMMEQHPTLTPSQAHAIFLQEKPKESQSKKEGFEGGSYKPKPKTLAELTDEEAQKLSPHDYLKYMKVTWQMQG